MDISQLTLLDISLIVSLICLLVIAGYFILKNKNLQIKFQNLNIEIATLRERTAKILQIENENAVFKNMLDDKIEENTKLRENVSRLNSLLEERKESLFEKESKILEITNNHDILQKESTKDKELISQLQTRLDEQKIAIEEKIELFKQNETKLKIEFENLANKIFTDNSKKFSEQHQKDLGLILNPMKQQLTDFKKKVEDVYDKESKDRSALQNELRSLKELNLKMSEEAHKLTTALKNDSKKQGKWGEMVLENVLESSGLRDGHEYKREVSLKDDENKAFRPDVIVNLPDKRHIIIDAKTSLTAYTEYMAEESEELKQVHLKSHIRSIKDHIKGLADKKYEDLKDVNTLDFIFMFVPIEGALLLALDNDVNLYDEAFKQKIILVSPTTLLVALRAVENTWRYERQAQNIAEVYKRAELLYSKFNGFIEDMKKIGDSISKADDYYQKAFNKLKQGDGNLIWQVTQLRAVSNIKPKKELDNVLVEGAMVDNIKKTGKEK